jgi:hypothetical protein
MQLTKNVVKECVAEMKSNKNLGELSIAELPIARTYWEKVKAFERGFYSIEGDETTDAARFFSKKAFVKVKGYDEKITGPEDWDITERITEAGFERGWVCEIIKHYEKVPNPLKVAQKKYYYGLKSHRYFKRHDIKTFSPKTIYFLRPVFYKNWQRLVIHPVLTFGMIVMFCFELFGGGAGYLVGKARGL